MAKKIDYGLESITKKEANKRFLREIKDDIYWVAGSSVLAGYFGYKAAERCAEGNFHMPDDQVSLLLTVLGFASVGVDVVSCIELVPKLKEYFSNPAEYCKNHYDAKLIEK